MFGKKSKINVDYQYVYTVFDKVANKCIGLWYSPTDENMIRIALPSILMDYSFRDIEIFRVGRFETNKGIIESINKKSIPLDKYTFPHSRLSSKGDDLSLDDVDKLSKALKSKAMSEIDNLKNKDSDSKEA